jgi:hypothetical protein
MSCVNTYLNAIRRRGLVKNKSAPKRMGHWYPTDIGKKAVKTGGQR